MEVKGVKKDAIKRPQFVETAPNTSYRDSNSLNQSMIKSYLSNVKQFYKEFVLKERRKEKDTYSLSIGMLVDEILVGHRGNMQSFEQDFEEKFCLFNGNRTTSQLYDLADKLYEVSIRDSNEEGRITTSFGVRFTEAYIAMQETGKFKGKDELKGLELFKGSDAEKYLKERLECVGKKVVDVAMLTHAKYIVEKTLSDDNVNWVFTGNDDIEQLNHFAIEWVYTTLFGDKINCKSELDIVHILHSEKVVRVFDNKIAYDNECFDYAYIKYSYYIQAAFYTMAIRWWLDNNGMKDYTIEPFRFVVEDSGLDNMRTLIYEMTDLDMLNALNGFVLKGTRYDGLYGAMEMINWSLSTGIFDISKKAYDANSIVQLGINYDV